MRAAIVMPVGDRKGGAETLLMHLLRANRREPCVDLTLAFLEDGPMRAEVESLGYATAVFPAGRLRSPYNYLRAVQALRGWLSVERPAVVLSWMAKAHIYAGAAARLADLPAAWWQHAVTPRNGMDRLATRIPAKAIFCCSEQARAAQESLSPRRAARVIYPAVDLERFDPGLLPPPLLARRILGLPEGVPVVGTVCRLQEQKGVHILIEAARRLRQERRAIQVVIVGGPHPLQPEYARRLEWQVNEAGLRTRVRFAGAQEDVPLWIQAMDTFVLPSVGSEGFGMALVEAMALGKGVIASRAGGPLEIVEDGVDGLLTPPGDAASLAGAIERTLEAGPATDAMRRAARCKAESFGVERFTETLTAHLTVLAAGTRSR